MTTFRVVALAVAAAGLYSGLTLATVLALLIPVLLVLARLRPTAEEEEAKS